MNPVSAVFAIVCLCACGRNYEAAVVGHWQVDASRSQIGGLKPNQQERLGKAYAAFTLTLKPDHTFEAKLFLPVQGSWSIDGTMVTLKPSQGPDFRLGGRTQPVLMVEDDGRTLGVKSDDPKSPGTLFLVKRSDRQR